MKKASYRLLAVTALTLGAVSSGHPANKFEGYLARIDFKAAFGSGFFLPDGTTFRDVYDTRKVCADPASGNIISTAEAESLPWTGKNKSATGFTCCIGGNSCGVAADPARDAGCLPFLKATKTSLKVVAAGNNKARASLRCEFKPK